MRGLRIGFQALEDLPSVPIRKNDVEQNERGLVNLGEIQSFGARRGPKQHVVVPQRGRQCIISISPLINDEDLSKMLRAPAMVVVLLGALLRLLLKRAHGQIELKMASHSEPARDADIT